MPPTSSHIQGPKGFVEWASYQLSSTIIDEMYPFSFYLFEWTTDHSDIQIRSDFVVSCALHLKQLETCSFNLKI